MFAIPILLLLVALVVLVVAPVAGWLLVVWLIVKHPLLSISIAVYIGLVMWLGAHDAQALAIYALMLLAIWRLVHKDSFQRLVGRRTRSPQRRSWTHDPPPAHDQRAVRPGETPPPAPTHAREPTDPRDSLDPEDPTNQIRTMA